MADGTRMDPHDDNAASKTLPSARGQGDQPQDRPKHHRDDPGPGPYVKGRIVDLSPATAEKIGITPKEGVAKVEVAPIAVPPRGEGARD